MPESTIFPSQGLRIWPPFIYSEEMEQRLAVILLASLVSFSVASTETRGTDSDQQGCDMSSRAQILSPLTGVKANYEVGLKSTQACGCRLSILPPPPFLVLSLFLLIVPFLKNWGNIHPYSSSLGGKDRLRSRL
jgi:hypothetical protein